MKLTIILLVMSLIGMVTLISLIQEKTNYPNLIKTDYIAKIEKVDFTYGGQISLEYDHKVTNYRVYPVNYADRDFTSEMNPGSLVLVQDLRDDTMNDISLVDSEGVLIAGLKPV